MDPSEVEMFRADLKKELTEYAEGFLVVALRMAGSKSTIDIYDLASQKLEGASGRIIQKKMGEAADAIFSHLKTKGMLVKRLPEVVAAINNEKTSLTGKKPAEAIKEKSLFAKPSSTYCRPVGMKEKKNYPSPSAFAIFTSPESWRAARKEQPTPSGL